MTCVAPGSAGRTFARATPLPVLTLRWAAEPGSAPAPSTQATGGAGRNRGPRRTLGGGGVLVVVSISLISGTLDDPASIRLPTPARTTAGPDDVTGAAAAPAVIPVPAPIDPPAEEPAPPPSPVRWRLAHLYDSLPGPTGYAVLPDP